MAREITSHAATAKAIRAALKSTYPKVVFKVRSDSFSGGNSVDIHWTDGPTLGEVNALTKQHEYGHFDGMYDIYEYSNVRKDIPQAKYVHSTRSYSRAATEAMVAWLNAHWAEYNLRVIDSPYGDSYKIDPASDAPRGNGSGWQSHDVYREMQSIPMLCGSCGSATLPGDAYCPQCGQSLTAHEQAA